MANILLIEDDAMTRILVREVLDAGEAVGMSLLEAHTAASGRALVDRDTACVLLDNNLPDGYGLDLVGELRAAWPDLAIIMMTGTGDEKIATEALKRGANDYLPKASMSPGSLLKAIGEVMDKAQLEKVLRANQALLTLLSELVDTAEDLLFVVDVRREAIVIGNAATRRALGRADDDLGRNPAPIANLFKAGESTWRELRALLLRISPVRFETSLWVGHYVGRPMEVSARLINQSGREFVIGIGRDIADRRALQSELLQHAAVDPQTGLPMRIAFLLLLQALARDAAGERRHWVLAAINLSVLDVEAKNVQPTAQNAARREIAQLLAITADELSGCAGSASAKSFLLAFPATSLKAAKDQLDGVQARITAELENMPRTGLRMVKLVTTKLPLRFGGLFGDPNDLVAQANVERAIKLAVEAELTGSLKLDKL